jgi:hypothetical protein
MRRCWGSFGCFCGEGTEEDVRQGVATGASRPLSAAARTEVDCRILVRARPVTHRTMGHPRGGPGRLTAARHRLAECPGCPNCFYFFSMFLCREIGKKDKTPRTPGRSSPTCTLRRLAGAAPRWLSRSNLPPPFGYNQPTSHARPSSRPGRVSWSLGRSSPRIFPRITALVV